MNLTIMLIGMLLSEARIEMPLVLGQAADPAGVFTPRLDWRLR